ncbi:MAG: alanine--tRNA ligase, partial [Haloplanus sp.]
DGEYEMKDGNRYSPMDTYIVDTGYGLERWTWMTQGTPTVYEAVYPEMIDFLTDRAGIDHSETERDLIRGAARLSGYLDIDEVGDLASARAEVAGELGVDAERLTSLLEPLEDVYAIADHCRTLAYMLGDGIVPSNVGTGYLARMVLRRTKRLVDGLGIDAPLDELVDMQAERLGYTNRDTIRDMVRTEEGKYRQTLERGRRKVKGIAEEYAARGDLIPRETLIELYDSHGIQPDMVAEIAGEYGASVDVPDDFYGLVAARHEGEEASEAAVERDDRLADLPETDRLFYDDQERTEFEAVVLDVFEREGGYDVVLDQTMFYPEGGGQPADTGSLSTDETTVEVTDVQRRDGVILHRTDGDPGKGEFVRGRIDAERRFSLMRHHTATHVIGYAARQVLGDHVRQAGAQKGTDQSRLDVRHFRRISRSEVKEIERVANGVVTDNHQVTQEWPDRHEAEAKYGFDLYQGGVPPGRQIRLIHVEDDVQACAGTHVSRTGDIGVIKILKTEPIQDGVKRIVFAAGSAAIAATQRTEDALDDAADVLDVSPEEVPETAERFFEEWKERGKQIDRLKQELAEVRAAAADTDEVEIAEGVTAVIRRMDADADELRATANAVVGEGSVAVLGSARGGSAQFVVGVPNGVDINAGDVVGRLAGQVGGGGGGPPDFAQGGGPDVDALDDALAEAPDVLRATRNA